MRMPWLTFTQMNLHVTCIVNRSARKPHFLVWFWCYFYYEKEPRTLLLVVQVSNFRHLILNVGKVPIGVRSLAFSSFLIPLSLHTRSMTDHGHASAHHSDAPEPDSPPDERDRMSLKELSMLWRTAQLMPRTMPMVPVLGHEEYYPRVMRGLQDFPKVEGKLGMWKIIHKTSISN